MIPRRYHMRLQMNFDQTSGAPLFCNNTTGPVGERELDLFSILLHEMAHASADSQWCSFPGLRRVWWAGLYCAGQFYPYRCLLFCGPDLFEKLNYLLEIH